MSRDAQSKRNSLAKHTLGYAYGIGRVQNHRPNKRQEYLPPDRACFKNVH
jgi:hypothetical protein